MDPLIFLMRAQRQGLVWSIDVASCGAAGQNRLPLRRVLWIYHSLGLGSRRLIHMKCGAISALALLFHRSSSCGKTDGSTPLTIVQTSRCLLLSDHGILAAQPLRPTLKICHWHIFYAAGASAEAGIENRHRLDARRICHSVAGCYQATTQSDQTRDS